MTVLRRHSLTLTSWAALPEHEQDLLMTAEMVRQREIAEWRDSLIKRELYTPEAALLLALWGG